MIKHIWFDFDGTLTVQTPEFHAAHNELRYQTYARAIGQPLTEQLKQDYEALYKKYASNSAVFRSLGLPSDYWQAVVNDFDVSSFYKPVPAIYETLDTLRKKVPISLFTNLKPQKVHEILPQINIPFSWFTH